MDAIHRRSSITLDTQRRPTLCFHIPLAVVGMTSGGALYLLDSCGLVFPPIARSYILPLWVVSAAVSLGTIAALIVLRPLLSAGSPSSPLLGALLPFVAAIPSGMMLAGYVLVRGPNGSLDGVLFDIVQSVLLMIGGVLVNLHWCLPLGIGMVVLLRRVAVRGAS